jgi:hypothetical protein
MAAHASRERLRRWHVAWSPLVARVRAGATVSELRAVDGAHVHGIGLGYEPLFDDDVLAPGMVVSLGLARDGVVGKETLLVSQARSDLLTAFPYASVG